MQKDAKKMQKKKLTEFTGADTDKNMSRKKGMVATDRQKWKSNDESGFILNLKI